MTLASVENAEDLSPIKRALMEIRSLRAQLSEAEQAAREPIAIVGMGMRFPGGVTDAESFAQVLWSGVDTVTEIPTSRWPLDKFYSADADAPGKMMTRYGAFIDDVDRFDAEFFGISPREAASMDPQQRILLEVMWEALENGGHAPTRLSGSRLGIYLGMANNDYGRAIYANPNSIDAYFSTGNALSVASGRMSYFLGAHGPSITVDTACSSSLVALHLACQGLRLRECDMALAGGVNLILSPEMNINFSKARMMATDGRCKTFDASADGYVRGEGCGVVALRRFKDAVAAGDRILAVIRGSAINQDGRSGGLTAPNGPAQEAVICAALEAAGVSADAISYVEAHGTGTPLGDPIEIGALEASLCSGRDRSHPLMIGSVKTNIGHTEAAAGIAGLIKVVLAFQRREIPPNLHFAAGNPHINWDAPIVVPTDVVPWRTSGQPRVAGVSSFGFSGTNAHVILEEAHQETTEASGQERSLHVLTLSARDHRSLVDLADRYQSALSDDMRLADVCYTANTGRAHFSNRAAIRGENIGEIKQGLAALVGGRDSPSVAQSQPAKGPMERPQVAFMFTGQGAQHAGMGRQLYETSRVFRDALDACAERLKAYQPDDLRDVMFRDATSLINDTRYAQPATFAIEYALAMLWRSWGVKPVAVLGHSLGEYAAACVAGLFTLDDSLRIVAERGRLAQSFASADGAMLSVFADLETVMSEVKASGGHLAIAAYNGPDHHVVSGRRADVEAASQRMKAAGIDTRLLHVAFGAHSSLVDPVLPAFRPVLEAARASEPEIALVSNVTGAYASFDDVSRPDYWLTHMREAVRFYQSVQTLAGQGVTHFVEIGPHPVLTSMGPDCLPGSSAKWLASLHRDRNDWTDLTESLQQLYVDGVEIDWKGFDQGYHRRTIALPTYPFRRVRHWMDIATTTVAPVITGDRWSRVTHALDRQADLGPVNLNAASYPEKWDFLARLTSAHAIRTLREADLFRATDERHTLSQLLKAAGIASTYQRLVKRWLERLVEQGLLRQQGESYISNQPLPEPDLPKLWREADRLLADNKPLLAYVRHCGDLVGQVLRGQESPLQTLFPDGSFELAEDLYQRSTTLRYVNDLAAKALETIGGMVPQGRVLRVLEVGAGTGGMTAELLPTLPEGRARYLFSDVSDFFLTKAEERFGQYDFVNYGRFDMDQDATAQGFEPASFDVILSANAVHASTDLRAALQSLRRLLRPGGTLILIESTVHFTWFDMTTGLIEGWQHFADNLRGDDPLLDVDAWIGAFREAGFDRAQAWPGPDSAAKHLGQHLLVASVDGDSFGDSDTVTEGDVGFSTMSTTVAAPTHGIRQSIDDARPEERIERLRDFVRDGVVRVLRLDPAEPPGRHDRLMDLGFDSLMAVQLRTVLGNGLGVERLPATLIFDHPTIEAISEYLLGRLSLSTSPGSVAEAESGSAEVRVFDATEIVAMSDDEIEAQLMARLEDR